MKSTGEHTFWITVKQNYASYRLRVTRVYRDQFNERYQVEGRNKIVVFENNRPLIRGKGLKKFPVTWKQVAGPEILASGKEIITKAIETKIDNTIT